MFDWKGRRVLVTGCSGFVGAHLCRRLLDLGADVVGLDLVTAEPPCLRALGVNIPILKRDVVSGDLAFAIRSGNGDQELWINPEGLVHERPAWTPPQVVFHLAGMSHIKACQDEPGAAWDSHVRGTYRLLEACRALPAGHLKAVVLAGSNHQYGSLTDPEHHGGENSPNARGFFAETDAPRPTDVYGAAKACVGLIGRAYGKSFGMPVVTLHHVNSYGSADPHRSHIVTGTICDLLEGKRPVIKSDGTPQKGYLHIDDVVSAYVRLAEIAADHPGEAFNAGPAKPIPVLDLVTRICWVTGHGEEFPIPLREDLSQSGYVEHLSSLKLRNAGWRDHIGLNEGLRRTFEWYQVQGGMTWTH